MTSLLQKIKELVSSVATKQDVLTAGDNITIDANNNISTDLISAKYFMRQEIYL